MPIVSVVIAKNSIRPLITICIWKNYNFPLFAHTDNGQHSNMAQCNAEGNVETHLAYAHVQIVQRSTMQASGLMLPKKELKQDGSLSSPVLEFPTAMSNEVKREATDQGRASLAHFQ